MYKRNLGRIVHLGASFLIFVVIFREFNLMKS